MGKPFIPVVCKQCGKEYNAVEFSCSFCGYASEEARELADLWQGWGDGWPMVAAYELAFGPVPEKWPLPTGQPLSWPVWARALNDEAVKRGGDPERWPMPESSIKGGNCFLFDWAEGKTVQAVIDELATFNQS